ncbi:MAG TPA: hypothetical protein VM240_10980 [Verrucomicrobiae bacterium]|nr:hypothetical protein [Verrucomicrobiae bacterium]
MTFEKAVKEVQGTLETVGERSQDVAKVSLKTLKAANQIIVAGVQDIVTAQTAAAKDLYVASKTSLEKAVADGLVAVVKSPVAYIPEGKDTIIGAFNETVDTLSKTTTKLVKVAKSGYEGVSASIQGKRTARATAKKSVRKVVATGAAA